MPVTDVVEIDPVEMGLFSPRIYVFTFKAIDSAGNQASWSGAIYVSILGIITKGAGGCGVVPENRATRDNAAGWFVIILITLAGLWIIKKKRF